MKLEMKPCSVKTSIRTSKRNGAFLIPLVHMHTVVKFNEETAAEEAMAFIYVTL